MKDLIKRFDHLLKFAEEFRNVKRSEVAQKFGYKRLTRRAKEEIIKNYQWGAILFLEDLIGFSHDDLVKMTKSASLRTSKFLSDKDVHVVNTLLTVNKNLELYTNLKPDLEGIRKLMGNTLVDTGAKTFRELVGKLADFKVFVVKGTLENVSGFTYGSFILINIYEKEERQLWTLIHETFHILKGEHGFRKAKNPQEIYHENEVANYIFKGLNLPEDYMTLEDIKNIKGKLNINISLNALIRYYKAKDLFIDKFDPTLRNTSAYQAKADRRTPVLKFPPEYLENLKSLKLEDHQLLELFGINPLTWEEMDAPVHEYLKTHYCY